MLRNLSSLFGNRCLHLFARHERSFRPEDRHVGGVRIGEDRLSGAARLKPDHQVDRRNNVSVSRVGVHYCEIRIETELHLGRRSQH